MYSDTNEEQITRWPETTLSWEKLTEKQISHFNSS